MIVITLSDCPPKVRGDLSKWLIEINTGVYVGQVSARVREELWKRICENLHTGRATMVFHTMGEQHMDFRVHNTTWEPVDFDGLKLMRRPLPSAREHSQTMVLEKGFSKAAKMQKVDRIKQAHKRTLKEDSYIVLDLETTGLSCSVHEIIEIAALSIVHDTVEAELSILVQCQTLLLDNISKLTGITDEMLQQQGIPLYQALSQLIAFVGNRSIVCHNAAFDFGFLHAACQRVGLSMFHNPCIDTLTLARRKIFDVVDYKLNTIASYFSLDTSNHHRALADCYLTYGIYKKLNEL
ncbi:MAG: type I-E CRISPR-associated endoribonuclease Cas2 [Clostridium sp.]|nr:type I-E CRISPR-associated endoribonuclease Cas2 [Clostridium sp.]